MTVKTDESNVSSVSLVGVFFVVGNSMRRVHGRKGLKFGPLIKPPKTHLFWAEIKFDTQTEGLG